MDTKQRVDGLKEENTDLEQKVEILHVSVAFYVQVLLLLLLHVYMMKKGFKRERIKRGEN